ncbi:MAG: hypothetical protein IE912_02555 [Brevundimonas diminuta]|nr:hypothetical protein [Brevundimonas diminuta]MBD3817783.1 hypothetical protein [Brevundimonas diminuta]
MSFPLVIIAGADRALFDTLSATSANAFAPNGARILRPAPDGLTEEHSAQLIAAARTTLKSLKETQPVNTIVLAITEPEVDDEFFRQSFFPFALYRRIDAPDFSKARSTNERNRMRNAFSETLKAAARDSRDRANIVKGHVSKANGSPFILPVRNFQSDHLSKLLSTIFAELPVARDPKALLAAAEQEFLRNLPYTTPPGSDRRCLSDRRHYFKSPGRHRHGYYQNSQDSQHGQTCLINARSRLGGAMPHDFHFDCSPTKRLDREYADCHDRLHPPKGTYINIAPSDAIIGS